MKTFQKHFEFDEFCLSCRYYASNSCSFKIRDGLTRWKKVGCTTFKED